MAGTIRLDKYLTDMGKGSRTQIREAARRGRILVNGEKETKSDRKIIPGTDQVFLDGAPVAYRALEYYMMNKPQGVISATEDKRHKTVIDLLDKEKRRDLFPAGRLDIDTEGLLLLTNDGELAHQLLSPKKHVDKQYFVRVKGQLPADAEEQAAAGMTLKDGTAVKPALLKILSERDDGEAEVLLTIREGKFHQVKRMFEAMGCQVTWLKRLSMGMLCLDETLKPGEYRPLTGREVKLLKRGISACSDGLWEALKQKKAVIFDLDGTLVDSMWMWHAIDIEYLDRYGYSCPPMLQREIEGMSFSETAVYFKEKFRIPESLDEIKSCWVRMSIEKYRSEVPLKQGALRFLQYLKGNGISMGIATSNGREMVDAVLNSLGIASYFQVVTTGCEVAAGKPAPDIYLKVAEQLGVSPADCMVFEDVPAGMTAGRAAGMTVCGVEDGHSAWMRTEKLKLSDFYIENYDVIFENQRNDQKIRE